MKKTFFGYKGSVDLKLTINNRIFELKTHNNGTDYLKKAFTKWLTGNSNTFDIPQFVDLKRQENDNFITCLNQDIAVTGKVFLQTTDDDLKLNNAWVARFNAAIPYSAVAFSGNFDGFDEGKFRLYLLSGWDSSESTYHDLAYIDLKVGSDSEISNFSPGTQMVIEWNMTLLNLEDFGIPEDDDSNNSNSNNNSNNSTGNYTSNNSNDTSNTNDENNSNNNQLDNSETGNIEGPSNITGNEGDDSGGDNEINPYTPIS